MIQLQIVPPIDSNPRVVQFAQTRWGQAVLVGLFLALLRVSMSGQLFVDTAIMLVLVTLFKEHRRTILLFGALYWAGVHVKIPWEVLATLRPRLDEGVELGDFGVFRLRALAAVLLFGALAHWTFRRRPDSWPARYPVWALLAVEASVLIALAISTGHGGLWLLFWGFALVLSSYLWFFAYSLLDLRRNRERGFVGQIGLFHPFWGSTNTPFPKGAAYSESIEAKDPRSLAVSQLKGLKLLWWSLVLAALAALLRSLFYGSPFFGGAILPVGLPIPPLEIAFRASVAAQPFPWVTNWGSMFLDLGLDALRLCVWGHQFVAVARLAGFNARRNTYKPFLATSVSEFFNRYYYYFKELLVDCFFYPVFYALPRKRFKLALAVATFAAAGLGNYIYHFLRDLHVTVDRGLGSALAASHVLAIYCACLALAIFLSQLRRAGVPAAPHSRVAAVRSRVLVWTTFAVLNTLVVNLWTSDIGQHARFLLSLIPGGGVP